MPEGSPKRRSRLPLVISFVLCTIGFGLIVIRDQDILGAALLAIALVLLVLTAPNPKAN
jgi:hypothetical protein